MGFNIQQYEQAIAKNGGDNWSNATGYTKEELISKIRTAKDSIEQWTNEKNSAQVRYDEANSRNCPSPCRDRCHPKCDTKTADKEYNLAILNSRGLSINTAQANIPVWQNELDDLIEKEANTTSPNTGGGATTGGGTTTTPKKSNTVLYASIGGAVLILGVVGYFVFRNK